MNLIMKQGGYIKMKEYVVKAIVKEGFLEKNPNITILDFKEVEK